MNQDRLLEALLELLKIDSESGQEAALAALLKEKFEMLGLQVTIDEAGNLIALLVGNQTDIPPILFTCHMDTVKPGIGVKPTIRDGVVYSDGTTVLGADDKAGIAALLEALRTIQETNASHGDIQIVLTVGEEVGLIGAKALNPDMLIAKFGYALDGGGVVGCQYIAAPSQVKLFVDVYGKTAHAGVAPEKGVSAITLAGRAISQMPLGRIDEETTANIGRIEGGTETNVVCEHVRFVAEVRSLVREKLDAQVQAMKDALETTAADMGGRVEIKVEDMYGAFKFDEADEVVQVANRGIEKIGREVQLLHTGGGSDANIFNAHGVPTTILGVGYEEIHTKNERMPIEELNKLAELVIAIVETV